MSERSSDNPAGRTHDQEKATIDHLVDRVYAPKAEGDNLKGARTEEGLSVEKQVRKEWDPKKGGLPIF